VEETVEGELEVHYFIAPGLDGYFASANGAATFTLPNFQSHAEAVFSVLAQRVDAPLVEATALAATGIDGSDVPALFTVLQAHGYVEAVTGSNPTDYHVIVDQKPFFADPANVTKFALPDFTAAFAVLAAKVAAFQRAAASVQTEAQELGSRLSASS